MNIERPDKARRRHIHLMECESNQEKNHQRGKTEDETFPAPHRAETPGMTRIRHDVLVTGDHSPLLEDHMAIPAIKKQEWHDRFHRLRREPVENGYHVFGVVRIAK